MQPTVTESIQNEFGYAYRAFWPVRGGGADVFYLADGLGSVRQLTDAFGQRMVSYMYDGFGNVRAVSGTA
ncbi:MAG TPA: hypothetical protein PLV55_13785, partial [Anaerohalosphaeraceae bacterium]|nr:hypothetical protein [Anaerohalosphaeraceae bacterium]